MSESHKGISPTLAILACALTLALGWWMGHTPSASTAVQTQTTKQLWTCGMHPQVIQDEPGLCPICHMPLTPLSVGDSSSAQVLTIDPVVVQNMGVRIEKVRRAPLVKSARFAGNVLEPESARREIVVRVAGWIRALEADTTGMDLAAGAPLFELDSPDLTAAIEELLAAARSKTESRSELARQAALSVHTAARRRLVSLGLDEAQIDQYEAAGVAPATVRFTTSAAAHLLQLDARLGMRVEPGMSLMTLSDRQRMWIDFAVPEGDLAWLEVGSRASVHIAALGTNVLEGAVTLILPHLDMTTRTARARIEVENPMLQLREGMSAEVSASARIEEAALVVPREAVIDTGPRQVAFVALGAGHFEARDLELGQAGDGGVVAVHSGLAEGEEVVVSGQFLLDAESRIREAIRRHLWGEKPSGSGNAREEHPAKPALEGAQQERTDEFFRRYLELAERLGGNAVEAEKLDLAPFVQAADALAGAGQGESESEPLAQSIRLKAEGLAKLQDVERRRAFAALSDLVIRLAQRQPPSHAVSPRLYIARCTMAPGSWLQRTESIANPFYADRMKTCGEIVGSIESATER
ncbi:MAG: efflux RND transporter periplasmic adaptor subunit [Planctomycetes bacterium]|nr:efflux RND transporter periplasmic adaptor subunit [Planctomycetota bacterium]